MSCLPLARCTGPLTQTMVLIQTVSFLYSSWGRMIRSLALSDNRNLSCDLSPKKIKFSRITYVLEKLPKVRRNKALARIAESPDRTDSSNPEIYKSQDTREP